MAPKDSLIPAAILACVISGISAAAHNNVIGAEMQKQQAIEAQSSEAQDAYNKHLDIVAKEAIASKLTIVTFDDNGEIIRIAKPYPNRSKTLREFKLGQQLSEDFNGNSSIGLFDVHSNKYAAIGVKNGQLQIIAVYSEVEVKNKVSALK